MHHLKERGGLTVRTDKFSKTNLILYTCGLIPVVWLALLVAPYLDGGLVEYYLWYDMMPLADGIGLK